MRILIAEDEPVTRASLARQLERWGHAVTASPDGEEAWARFGESEFDLVITDWEMPRLSGVELIQRIRSAPEARFVYIVMLTGRTNKADLVGGIEAGADDFVAKPFDREELRVRLLAGERIVSLERKLHRQNAELQEASERMRYDLRAASRVQRSMLPRGNIVTPRVRTAWGYVPTDELAGDAIGLHLIADRYLVAYVIDVSGHGVPAALLSVTAMHALAPAPGEASLLRDMSSGGPASTVRPPSQVAFELNRRFRSGGTDDRFLTMVLCVLDTFEGRLRFTCAGHPPPILIRNGAAMELEDVGSLPIAVLDEVDFGEGTIRLEPGDRVCLFSDGVLEQMDAVDGVQFGVARLRTLLCGRHSQGPQQAVDHTITALAAWAGCRAFSDDVSLVTVDWLGDDAGGLDRRQSGGGG